MASIKHAYIIYIDKPESIDYANQCAHSCQQYGMPYTLWPGVQINEHTNLEDETGFKWAFNSRGGDSGCTASHLKLWRVIAEQEHACCIFEHDAMVTHNFYGTEIPDKKVVMLGYRVLNSTDYEYPGGDTSFIDVTKFEGTHAYAITPNMAKHLIYNLEYDYTFAYGGVDTTIDGLISVCDRLGVDRCVMDPPPAICVVGNRVSTIQSNPAAYNTSLSPGFQKGLKANPLRVT